MPFEEILSEPTADNTYKTRSTASHITATVCTHGGGTVLCPLLLSLGSGYHVQRLNMAAGVAMPEIKTGGPSVGLVDKKEASFETNIRPEDKVRAGEHIYLY